MMSFNLIPTSLASASAASYAIPHLYVGDISNLSAGDVRCNKCIDASSIICAIGQHLGLGGVNAVSPVRRQQS